MTWSKPISTNIGHESSIYPARIFRSGRYSYYISQFNPDAAGRVVAVIEKIALRLGDFPESGQPSDELDARVVFSPRYPYRIYYRIASSEVLILHIRHAARRPLQPREI